MKKRIIKIIVISCLLVLLCSAFAFADNASNISYLEGTTWYFTSVPPRFSDYKFFVYSNSKSTAPFCTMYYFSNSSYVPDISLATNSTLFACTYYSSSERKYIGIYHSDGSSFNYGISPDGYSSISLSSLPYCVFVFPDSFPSGLIVDDSFITFLNTYGHKVVSVSPLPTPDVSVSSSGLVSWDAYTEGQPDLRIDKYNPTTQLWVPEAQLDYNDVSWQLSSFGQFRMKAIATSSSYEDSEFAYFEFNGSQLSTPSNLRIIGDVLHFDSVAHSSQYIVEYSVDGVSWSSRAYITPNQYNLDFTGFYRVKAEATGFPYYDSEWSAAISFGGLVGTQLQAPTLSYNQNTNTLVWSSVSHATGYRVYYNNYVLTTTYSFSYQPSSSGTYTVVALGNGSDYITSNKSNSVIVSVLNSTEEPDEPGVPSVPDEPTNKNIIEWIKYGIEYIGYIFESIIYYISYLFDSAVSGIQVLIEYIKQFTLSIGDLFAFVPEEIKRVLISLLFITSLFYLFNLFKK